MVYFSLPARLDHGLYLDRMWTVHDSEDVITADEAEAGPSALQVVDGLAHVSFCAENQSCKPVFRTLDLFCFYNLHKALNDLGIGEASVSEDGTPRLQRFDDFVGLIACECEPRRVGVDLHCASESLLGS